MALTPNQMTPEELDRAWELAENSPIWESHDNLSFFIEGGMIKIQGYDPELVDESVPYSGLQWAKAPIGGEAPSWELLGEWVVS